MGKNQAKKCPIFALIFRRKYWWQIIKSSHSTYRWF